MFLCICQLLWRKLSHYCAQKKKSQLLRCAHFNPSCNSSGGASDWSQIYFTATSWGQDYMKRRGSSLNPQSNCVQESRGEVLLSLETNHIHIKYWNPLYSQVILAGINFNNSIFSFGWNKLGFYWSFVVFLSFTEAEGNNFSYYIVYLLNETDILILFGISDINSL